MAVYKVPQDVEADDKLLGPLSFRQFIYAVIAVTGCAVAFFLSKIFIGLVIIPLPIIILFAILALPLRKDQPMEMYLIAIIRFMLKPRYRLWQPEGNVALVQIVAPRVVEEIRSNGLSQDEARSRLDYLAQLMDSRGWSTKGTSYPGAGWQPVGPSFADSDIANDIMDSDASVARNFDNLIAKKDAQRQQEARLKLEQLRTQSNAAPAQQPRQSIGQVSLDEIIEQQQQRGAAPQSALPSSGQYGPDDGNISFNYNPYPQSIHQHIIQPLGAEQSRSPRHGSPRNHHQENTATNPVTTSVSPDIMRLATESKNLSISTLANEAHRLQQKQDENEVVVSLH